MSEYLSLNHFKLIFEGERYSNSLINDNNIKYYKNKFINANLYLVNPQPIDVILALYVFDGIANEIHFVSPDLKELIKAEKEKELNFETLRQHLFSRNSIIAHDNEFNHTQKTQTTFFMYTSGTTGVPKRIGHTLHSLFRNLKRDNHEQRKMRGGLIYQPYRMAGVQVICHALINDIDLFSLPNNSKLSEKIEYFRDNNVNFLSATPTLWRQILQLEGSSTLDLIQITMGGEIADQKLLNALKKNYPNARITHVYALTETGSILSVSDELEGIPIRFTMGHRAKLKIINDELYVLNNFDEMRGTNYFPTGDMVYIKNSRIYFSGRKDGTTNIGGLKVYPDEIAQLIREHPNVIDVSVKSKKNFFSGEILIAQVVLGKPIDENNLRLWLREQVPSHKVPAIIEFVSLDSLIKNDKIKRS